MSTLVNHSRANIIEKKENTIRVEGLNREGAIL